MADGARGAAEREVKLAAPVDFRLPDLSGLAEGVTSEPVKARELDALYYDTSDLRLARSGVTMRFRSGDGTGWTVKLPEGDDGPMLVRREVPFPGGAGEPPEAAADLVRGYARLAPLVPTARLKTHREGIVLRDGEGHLLAEVVDDNVTVLDGEVVAARFREVEVEVDRRAPNGLLREVLRRLRRAGAGAPDPTPKLMHALGERAKAPPEVSQPELGDHPRVAEVVGAAVAGSVGRILRHDAGVRLGDDPEDVHQARVGTRRLRSDLRTFAPLLQEGWAAGLRAELKWLATHLGTVRDIDVLTERLRRQARDLPDLDAASFAPLLRQLADDREVARGQLLEVMGSARYVALLDRLVDAAGAPPVGDQGRRRGEKVLPELVGPPWRKLRKAVRDLPDAPSDGELHGIRIRAKRARYAAEAVAPAVGKRAEKFAAALADLQEVLGDQHDAVVAEEWLRRHVLSAGIDQAVVLGELVAAQRVDAAHGREAWPSVWKKASRQKLRKWLP